MRSISHRFALGYNGDRLSYEGAAEGGAEKNHFRIHPLRGNPRRRSRTSQVSSPRKSSAPIRDLASVLSPEILGSDPGPRRFPVVQPWKCKNSPMRCLFGDLHWLLKIFWNFPCPVAMVRSWRCGTHLIPPSRADASRRTSYVGFEKSLRRRVQN